MSKLALTCVTMPKALLGVMQTIFLVGPTAVGKSAVALELARRLNGEIVSADSMQVYRGLDIGTAKPTVAERRAVSHHLIDICESGEPFDVKRFVNLAATAITDIQVRGKTALVVGGTGLYVRALRHGLFDGPGRDPELRKSLECKTTSELFDELQRVDPLTAAKIDRHNPRRLVRALEVFYATGTPIAKQQTEWGNVERASSPLLGMGVNGLEARSTAFCLTRDRADLNARIEHRIDVQIAAGWVEEVRGLLVRGLEKNPTAMQAAGYRELVAHLRGELSLTETVALIKTRTRQLAKRQMTWFRREPGLTFIDIEVDEPPTQTAERILKIIEGDNATH